MATMTLTMNSFLHLFLGLLPTFFAYGQTPATNLGGPEEIDYYYEISNLYHQRSRTFSCEFINKEIQRIKLQKIDQDLQNEIQNLENSLREATTAEDKADLEKFIQLLQSVKNLKEPKNHIIKALEVGCKIIKYPIITSAKAIAMVNSFALHTASLPVGVSYHFLVGLFHRQQPNMAARSDFIHRVLGPSKSIPTYLLGSIANEGINYLLFGAAPFYTVFSASIAVEMITNYACFHKNKLNKEQVEFCKDYEALRDLFYGANTKGFKFGQKVQKLIDKRIIEQRKDMSVVDFCKLTPLKQLKRAKKALTRYDFLQNDSRIEKVNILFPIQKNPCTRIVAKVKNELDITSLKSQRPQIEGIEIIYSLDAMPEEYFFTPEEIEKMPFEDKLCYNLELFYYNRKTSIFFNKLTDFYKQSLTPELLGSPEFHKINIPNSSVRLNQNYAPPLKELKNLIFIIGLNADETIEAEKLHQEKDIIQSRIKKHTKALRKAKDFYGCKEILQQQNVNMSQFEADIRKTEEIYNSSILTKQTEYKAITKMLKKARGSLRLDWEVISAQRFNVLTEMLKSPEIANLILVVHAKPNGLIVDSSGVELPTEYFKLISPNLHSINLFSCNSNISKERYQLKEIFKKSSSFYKLRTFTSVKQNDFMEADKFAPISSFSSYLKEVDRYLNEARKGAHLFQTNFGKDFPIYTQKKACTIDLTDLNLTKGVLGVVLNQIYLGALESTMSGEEKKFFYPCDQLKEANNTLILKNIINGFKKTEVSNFKEAKIKMELITGETKIIDASYATRLTAFLLDYKF